jgi:hypothetical protein
MLDNVPVPVENVLGTIGEGHKVAFNILNLGRVKLGTRNSAGIRLALNQSIAYARQRRQFGKAICEFGLVKQKLAEMTVRCFVSEAMVYRTLGDVDKALESVDPADAAGVLKAIEGFAVECSINKVATSEALGYAVDEAVQVFGGNGYSREFPVERAYRDARITRIYEGTNEINRLIIATRLLKHAESWLTHEVAAEATNSVLEAERQALVDVKRLGQTALATAARAFGAAVRDQQEVLAHAADVILECYAIESALGRAEKMTARGSERAAIAVDIVRVYTSDAMDRVVHAGKQIVNALAGQAEAIEPLVVALARVREHPGTDTVGARRRIGDLAIAHSCYPF